MQSTAEETCLELMHQWGHASSIIFVEEKTQKKVRRLLDEVQENIDICDAYEKGKGKYTAEYGAIEYGEAFLTLHEKVKRLDKEFLAIVESCRDRPDIIEEANLLVVLNRTLSANIQVEFKSNDKTLPYIKSKMNNHNNHPDYPTYPEGVLLGDDLKELHRIRDTLGNIRKADIILTGLSPDEEHPARILLNAIPALVPVVGNDPAITRDQLDASLQAKFASTYNDGVALFSRAFGIDGAEDRMMDEITAIENYYALPVKTTNTGRST